MLVHYDRSIWLELLVVGWGLGGRAPSRRRREESGRLEAGPGWIAPVGIPRTGYL